MGTTCRVLIEDNVRDPAPAGAWARRHLEHAARALTRFEQTSELSRLNHDPRETVEISPLLHAAIGAALWAAAATDGLVDPTLHDAINAAGYSRSLAGSLCESPPMRRENAQPQRARPSTAQRWRQIRLGAHTVTRPPGLKIDTGGTTKGLLADSVGHALSQHGFTTFVVDCGGDMRVNGAPRDVNVTDPRDPGATAATITITNGAVASSGIARRHWRHPETNEPTHHLLDPSTGEPAWTGVLSATALAPTALEAEACAKAAFLEGTRTRLHPHGGLLIHDNGRIE